MSEIVKTRAIVLRRLDFGDTSRIAHFFTEEYGKLSAMVKEQSIRLEGKFLFRSDNPLTFA